MSVVIYEHPESRNLSVGPGTTKLPYRLVALGSDDHQEVWLGVLLWTPATLLGLVRKTLDLDFHGGGVCTATLVYEQGDASEALQPEGTTTEPEPPSPPEPGTPIVAKISSSSGGGTKHIVLSKETLSSVKAGGGAAEDLKRAIGVTKDSVEGCDITVPNVEFSIAQKRRVLTPAQKRSMESLTGKTNSAAFWGAYQATELLYLGLDVGGDWLSGWDLTHKFRFDEKIPDGDPRLVVTPDLTITGHEGHSYIHFRYRPTEVADGVVSRPFAAYVERVYDRGDFSILGLG